MRQSGKMPAGNFPGQTGNRFPAATREKGTVYSRRIQQADNFFKRYLSPDVAMPESGEGIGPTKDKESIFFGF